MHAYVCIHLILKLCIAHAPWYNMHVAYSTIDDTAIVQIYSVRNPLHLIKKVYVCVFLLAILYRWTNSF